MRIAFLISLLLFISCGEKQSEATEEKVVIPSSEVKENQSLRIIFFGDSLTAGYGLTDYEASWPHLVVSRLAKEGYHFEMTNAGVSGDTSSGGLGRIDWVLSQKPDIFILELGANDMLRGIPPIVTRKNLKDILQKVKREYPKCEILLIGMRATPNLGKQFRSEFDVIYIDLARDENVDLVPFLLEKVAGLRKMNQKDGIHPTEEGHKLVADTVYPFIKKLALKVSKKK